MRPFVLATAALVAWISAAQAQSGLSPPAAIVNGVEISLDELEGQFTLQQQIYDIKLNVLQQLIGNKLLELASKRSGLTVDQMLRDEIDAKVEPASDAEIYGYYLAQRDRYGAPLDRVREQVAADVREAKIQEARNEFGQRIRSSAKVAILLDVPRAPVDIGDAPRRGGTGPGVVTLVEFGDYQCPYCRGIQETVDQLRTKYGDRVSFVFKDFPLREIHPQAQAAAEAASCAKDQGRFWEYHDALFRAPDLSPDMFRRLASELHLDAKLFEQCLGSNKHTAHIEADIAAGMQMGMTGTPAFNINGIVLTGIQPLADFERLIDKELLHRSR
jgi:protein-disulfide isomerase